MLVFHFSGILISTVCILRLFNLDFCFQLESQLNVFTSDVLPQLMEPWENCSKIYNDITKEKSSFNYHSDTSTSEIIHLSLLFDRINQVETVFKVRSERMRSTLQIISNSNRDKSECLEYETSANNISIIFDCKIDKESSSVRDILDSYTLGASGITYKSGTVGDLAGFTTRSPHIATEENEDRISQKVGSMVNSRLPNVIVHFQGIIFLFKMLDAFVWTPEEKLQIECKRNLIGVKPLVTKYALFRFSLSS